MEDRGTMFGDGAAGKKWQEPENPKRITQRRKAAKEFRFRSTRPALRKTFFRHSLQSGTTSRARCFETEIRAIVPPLNSRKSDSTPSEKITPPEGICDSTTSSSPS